MKVIIEYNLDNPESKKAHLRVVKSTDMAIVLFEILNNVKKKVTNSSSVLRNNQELSHEQGVEDVMYEIRKLCEDYNLNIDELLD